jgi:anaerobic selenocysteine-containing dehydrogenase
MERRKFLSRLFAGAACTTAGVGLVSVSTGVSVAVAKETRMVTWYVRGFTCVTCATGLETMLLRQKGVTQARASYPDAKVIIGFDEGQTSEETLRNFISDCGFSVG